MTRFSVRPAFTALALGVALLGGAALTSGEASAKGKHGGGFHGGWHGGYRYWGPRYVGLVGVPYVGGCVVKRIIDEDGDILLRKVCY